MFRIKETKSGSLTCLVIDEKKDFFLHSSYDPQKEAKRFITYHMDEIKNRSKIIVYGLGCGYHIFELLEQTKNTYQEIEVWDWNVEFYQFIKDKIDFEELFGNERVTIHITDDKTFISNKWRSYKNNFYLLIHESSLRIIPSHLNDLKELLKIYQLNTKTMLKDRGILEQHFNINFKDSSLKYHLLINSLEEIPMVLVSAGPSLKKTIPILKENASKVLIGSVGTALKPLVHNDIIPDFIMMTDPADSLQEQFLNIKPTILKKIPLFYLATISPKVISLYQGPKIMLLQKGFIPAEKIANEKGLPLLNTGGSVATTLLDWMVKLGAKQVVFIGQDLAYTNNETHTVGTHNYRKINDVKMQNLQFVKNYYEDDKVLTSMNLLVYKKWFENYIRRNGNIAFYNATQGGAFIEGCMNVKLEEYVQLVSSDIDIDYFRTKFKKMVNEIVD